MRDKKVVISKTNSERRNEGRNFSLSVPMKDCAVTDARKLKVVSGFGKKGDEGYLEHVFTPLKVSIKSHVYLGGMEGGGYARINRTAHDS